MTLSKKLKEGTKKSHSIVENTTFIVSFLNGIIDQKSYKKLLSNFYFIYSAMEDEMEKLKGNSTLSLINYSELNRKKSLEKDLNYFYGSNWESYICPSTYTKLYVNRIKIIAKDFPELLIAHHYTRYLGDLSGGQILKNIVKKSLKLNSNTGLAFYEFDDIKNINEFKLKYKSSLDSMFLDESVANKIIEEANYAFSLNMHMFKEFEGNFAENIIKFFVRMF